MTTMTTMRLIMITQDGGLLGTAMHQGSIIEQANNFINANLQ